MLLREQISPLRGCSTLSLRAKKLKRTLSARMKVPTQNPAYSQVLQVTGITINVIGLKQCTANKMDHDKSIHRDALNILPALGCLTNKSPAAMQVTMNTSKTFCMFALCLDEHCARLGAYWESGEPGIP